MPDELVNKVLQAAQWAPSRRNPQRNRSPVGIHSEPPGSADFGYGPPFLFR
jgi:hypothetical protein